MSKEVKGKGVATLCPDCFGGGKCPLCTGSGTVAPVLAAIHVETIEQNTRLAARNAELTAALKAVWEADEAWLKNLIDGWEMALTRDARRQRDAWRMVRDALEPKGGGA